ncbi:MAG: hypothetical protein K0B15_16285 [Lentimicrobium sp.]|nr:hypothetical protein [Lentimicrobium sp.]
MKTQKVLVILVLLLIPRINLQAQDINFGFLSGLVVSNASVTDKIEKYKDYRVFYPMYSFNINGSVGYRFSET